jgi:hypothetical protein
MRPVEAIVTTVKGHPRVVGGCVAVGVLLGGAFASDPNGVFGQTVAAWVQAVGSIAAIIAAIWIAQGANRQSREDQREAMTRRLAQLIGIAALCMERIDQYHDAVEGKRPQVGTMDALRDMLATLNRYPVDQIPTAKASIALVSFVSQAQFFIGLYDRWQKNIGREKEGFRAVDVEAYKDQPVAKRIYELHFIISKTYVDLAKEWLRAAKGGEHSDAEILRRAAALTFDD